jgi:RNA polymerase sigma-70 factor, ECF subfamily
MADMDVVLWNKIKSGDNAAFEILFQSYYTILCLFAKRYTHDMNLSKEIVQDLFVYLWEHRDKLSINISIKAYLYRAVRFNALRRLENEKKLGIRMDIIPEPDDPEFNDHLEYAELQTQISEAIEALPEQCQHIFKLSRFEQLKYAEIAEKLNLSVKTIEAQISKALRMIHLSIDHMLILLIILFL